VTFPGKGFGIYLFPAFPVTAAAVPSNLGPIMQPDTKLPSPWEDDDAQAEPREAPPAVVVPFPSKRASKKAFEPEIQAAIAAIDARKRAISRERRKQQDDDDEDAPAAKMHAAPVPVRPINRKPLSELARKGEQHPLYAWQTDLDKKIARNGGQLIDDLMCQQAGLKAAWRHAKTGDALLAANAGYVAARKELQRIRAGESKFDPAKGELEGWLYRVAKRDILNAVEAETSAFGKRIDTSKLDAAVRGAVESGYSPKDAAAFFDGGLWEHALLVSAKSPKTAIVRSSDAPTENSDGEAIIGSDWLDALMEDARATLAPDGSTQYLGDGDAEPEPNLGMRLVRLMATLVADGRLTRVETEMFAMKSGGVPQDQIASKYQISQSTVSRLLTKAQAVIEQAAKTVV
jgi:DNA-binding CsgD family transcriptional regulator